MPSDHSFASASSSLSGAVLSSSESSVALSSSQFWVTTLSSSQTDLTVSSRRYNGALSLSQSHFALSSSQPRATFPSNKLNITSVTQSSNQFGVTLSSASSQSHGTLSLSQFHAAPSSALTTLQEGIKNTDRLGGTTSMYSTLETLQMLGSFFLSDRTILSTNNTIRTRKTSTSSLVWYPAFATQPWSAFNESLPVNSEFMQDTIYASGQSGLTLVRTSSITSGHSASLISRTIFQLHQPVESSNTLYSTNDNSNEDNAGISTKTSASPRSSLSVGGDLPLSRTKPPSLDISASSTHKTSNLIILTHEDSLVKGTPDNSAAIYSLHQESMEKTQHTSLHSLAIIHNQTGLAGVASDSTSSTSKESIMNSLYNEASSRKSWNYNLHSSSKSDISNIYFSVSLDDMSTDTLTFSSMSSWNRSIIASRFYRKDVHDQQKVFFVDEAFS